MDKQNNQQKGLPKEAQSYWLASTRANHYPSLDIHEHADVCVVGAGITGVIAAYLLAKAGKQVVLIEADEVLGGTTGHTTAKITTQHGIIYDQLMKTFGEEAAWAYYDANEQAAQWLRTYIQENDVDCALQKETAYIYATTDEGAERLKTEQAAYDKLGIPGKFVEKIPLQTDITAALALENQAQFHPVHLLQHILEAYIQLGGKIYEHTTAVNITDEKVEMKNDFTVTADDILICTHYPFYEGKGLYATRMYASRSYVLAAKPKQAYPGGMYLQVEQPDRSLRSVMINGESHVLIVGEGHRTGDTSDTLQHYEALYQFGVEQFGIEHIAYRWSAQDLITLDLLPYIGPITKGRDHVHLATGYRKWGMTNGVAAAQLLTDIVLEKENPFRSVVQPSRKLALSSAKHIVEQNWIVAKHLVSGKWKQVKETVDTMETDSGAIVSIDGEKKGVYKNKAGDLFIVDTTCTHVGCEVVWNNGEKSWDCPCHGSRFTYEGEVIEGPAEKPLQTYDYHMLDNLFSDDSGY